MITADQLAGIAQSVLSRLLEGDGRLQELVADAVEEAVKDVLGPVDDTANVFSGRGTTTLSTEQPAAVSETDDVSCPKCGGRMWDNRLGKRNPKAPDFKCRLRSCDGVIWPARV